MSRSLNKALLIGNLGSDPEVRTTGDGTKVAGLSVATSRSWTDRDGQPQERTEWHRITAWTHLADIAEQYLKKGDRVYVEGEIQYRSYEDRDGVTRYVTEIRARELVMLGGRECGTAAETQPTRSEQQKRTPARKKTAGYEDFQAQPLNGDDDPF